MKNIFFVSDKTTKDELKRAIVSKGGGTPNTGIIVIPLFYALFFAGTLTIALHTAKACQNNNVSACVKGEIALTLYVILGALLIVANPTLWRPAFCRNNSEAITKNIKKELKEISEDDSNQYKQAAAELLTDQYAIAKMAKAIASASWITGQAPEEAYISPATMI